MQAKLRFAASSSSCSSSAHCLAWYYPLTETLEREGLKLLLSFFKIEQLDSTEEEPERLSPVRMRPPSTTYSFLQWTPEWADFFCYVDRQYGVRKPLSEERNVLESFSKLLMLTHTECDKPVSAEIVRFVLSFSTRSCKSELAISSRESGRVGGSDVAWLSPTSS